jgi:rod shape-determining protein MreC
MKHKRLTVVLLILIIVAIFLLPELQKRPLYYILRPFVYITSSLQSVMMAAANGLGNIWGGYIAVGDIHEDNLRLNERITQLQNEKIELMESQASLERLESLLELKKQSPYPLIASRVIARDPGNWYRSMTIDKGADDGVAVEMGVIVPAGVVGRVMKTTPDTSYVLLLTDHRSAIPALVQQTRDEGLVVGIEQERAKMKYIPILSEVQANDFVLTSGLVGSFPKGLTIGRISKVEKKEMELFQEAEIVPMVDFSKLEEVVVIAMPGRTKAERNPVSK